MATRKQATSGMIEVEVAFALPERQNALVDYETPVLYFKFCVNYVD